MVLHKGIPIGGLAIPTENSDEFIQVFRTEYQSLGLDAKLLASSASSMATPAGRAKPPERQTQANPYNQDF